jgi:outer membrane protein
MRRSISLPMRVRTAPAVTAHIFGGALLCCTTLAAAQQSKGQEIDFTKPISLKAAIMVGLRNQPTLAIAKNQQDASKARVGQAMSRYFPTIAPSVAYTNQLSAFQFQGQRTTATIEQTVSQIALRQTILDSGRREETLLANRYNEKASEHNVRDARQIVIVNVTTSFYDLLRTRELVKVAQAGVDRAKTTLDATRAGVEAKTIRRIDVLQAEADYDNARVSLITAQNNVRLAETNLKNAMGLVLSNPILVEDTQLPTPGVEDTPPPVSSFMKLAFDNRPDLQRDRNTIDSSRHSVKLAQINGGLQVSADITEGYRFDPAPRGENRTFSTTFSYPLFDGGLSRSQIREAKANLETSKQQLELTRQTIQLAVEQAYLLREEARARVSATQRARNAARANYQAAIDSLKEGVASIVDVITAQSALITAETNAVNAVFDFHSADARLQRAIGANDQDKTLGGTTR